MPFYEPLNSIADDSCRQNGRGDLDLDLLSLGRLCAGKDSICVLSTTEHDKPCIGLAVLIGRVQLDRV